MSGQQPTPKGPTRVLLVEAHLCIREALACLLDREPDVVVVGQAGSLAEGRDMSRSNGFDVAMVDLSLPNGDASDLIGDLRKANPAASVLVLGVGTAPEKLAGAEESGAVEVLGRGSSLDEMILAIRHSGNGTVLVS